MRRTKKSTALRPGLSGEGVRRRKERARVQPTDDELERRVRSALEDVYEVLLVADESDGEKVPAGIGLVNDLTH